MAVPIGGAMEDVTPGYIVPVYRHLAVAGNPVERDAFIAGKVMQPTLRQSRLLPADIYEQRLAALQRRIAESNDPLANARYAVGREQLSLLAATAHLGKAGTSGESKRLLRQVRTHSTLLYGEPDATTAAALLVALQEAAQRKGGKRLTDWQYIATQTAFERLPKGALERPSEETFLHYRSYFMRYAPWLFQDGAYPDTIEAFLQLALQESGADKKGWHLDVNKSISHTQILYRTKKLVVSDHYHMHRWKGMRRIAVHEVYGHINRSLHARQRLNIAESEGFAVLLEQLLRPTYSMVRSYRYLAVAAGWGVFGEPMNFRQVYELLWRAMSILSSYRESVAKIRAYNECVRAFRIGRPDLAGAVLSRDAAYFKGNVAIWRFLSDNDLTYNEFVDILEGRRVTGVQTI